MHKTPNIDTGTSTPTPTATATPVTSASFSLSVNSGPTHGQDRRRNHVVSVTFSVSGVTVPAGWNYKVEAYCRYDGTDLLRSLIISTTTDASRAVTDRTKTCRYRRGVHRVLEAITVVMTASRPPRTIEDRRSITVPTATPTPTPTPTDTPTPTATSTPTATGTPTVTATPTGTATATTTATATGTPTATATSTGTPTLTATATAATSSSQSPSIAIESVSPSQPEAGQTISFKVKVKNLDRSVTYTVQVRTASRTDAIRFNSCSDTAASISMNLAADRTGIAELSLSGSVQACNGGGDIHAKLTSGGTAAAKKSIHVSALPKPSKLRANGNSTNGNNATVRWNPVDSDVSYELRYGRECESTSVSNGVTVTTTSLCSPPLPNSWSEPASVAAVSGDTASHTLTGLTKGQIYRVRINAVRGGVRSDSSDLFLYTSSDPPTGSVATYSFSSALANGHYQYTICKGSFSTSTSVQDEWEADIQSGIESWETGVKWKLSSNRNIIRASKTGSLTANTGDCAEDAESSAVKGFDSNMDFRRKCGWFMSSQHPEGVACSGSASRNIFIDMSGDIRVWRPGVKTSSGCSDAHRAFAHEAGHVFGISGHPTIAGSIILSRPSATTCRPNAYDILAMMALYQSR